MASRWAPPAMDAAFGAAACWPPKDRLGRPRRPPSQTWRTFLTTHVAALASIDFFTVPTVTGRVLFVLVVLRHHRRRIVHVNVTEHPTAPWTAQHMIEACPNDTAPRWLVRDRDAIYGDTFRRRVAGMGIAEGISTPSSPYQKPYAERLTLTDDSWSRVDIMRG